LRAGLPVRGRDCAASGGGCGGEAAGAGLLRDLAGRHDRRRHARQGADHGRGGGAGGAAREARSPFPRHLRPGAGQYPGDAGAGHRGGRFLGRRARRLPLCQRRVRQRRVGGCALHAGRAGD
jgi:hypothetical protein